MAAKTALIIHPTGNAFNNPTLKCLVDLLLENGYQIDVRHEKSIAPLPPTEGITYLPYGPVVIKLKRLIFEYLNLWILFRLSVTLERIMLYKPYNLIVGVDRVGLIEAHLLHKMTNTPYVFVSFEIMFLNETSARYKAPEEKAASDVSLWIVQDEARATLLRKENNLAKCKQLILPLASAGVSRASSTRVRDQLGIDENRKVAIMMGSISHWTMAAQVIATVNDWPLDWDLIIHERYGLTEEALRQENISLSESQRKRIYFSSAKIDKIDHMSTLLTGINVGLAFYQPDFSHPFLGKNIEHIGMASGKISTYLRHGVPVIMNEIGMYACEAKKHGFGLVASRPDQIKCLLPKINLGGHSEKALKYYSEQLDFNLYRSKVLSRLLEVAN